MKEENEITERKAKGVLERLLDEIDPESLEKTRQEMMEEARRYDREQAQRYLLRDIEKRIIEEGEGGTAMMAPQPGKNVWTWKEMKEAVLEDKELEGGGGNPIDDLLKYEEYRLKHGMGSLLKDIENESGRKN